MAQLSTAITFLVDIKNIFCFDNFIQGVVDCLRFNASHQVILNQQRYADILKFGEGITYTSMAQETDGALYLVSPIPQANDVQSKIHRIRYAP
ncbi:MAG: hypothetical protein R2865_12295 [Deinococcales bacterium]